MPDPSFLFAQALSGLTAAMFLFLIASGLSLIFGVLRVLNFAHGSFYMIGAYLAFQIVQWLGENPFAYEQATREFTETTLGVFVAVVKASGLALVGCLAVGGFFGALLFSLRRAQQRAKEAYSDSDAMLRLNLDELTPESDPARVLGRGN